MEDNDTQETKGNEEEGAVDNSDEGDKQKESSVIDRANSAAERLEKATEAQKRENDRTERLLAEQKLGGQSGLKNPPKEKKEVDDESYAKDALEGKIPLKN